MNRNDRGAFTDFIIEHLFDGQVDYREDLYGLINLIANYETNTGNWMDVYQTYVGNTDLCTYIEEESLKMIVCFVKKLLIQDSIELFMYSTEEDYYKYENNGQDVCFNKDGNREEFPVAATTQLHFFQKTFTKPPVSAPPTISQSTKLRL